MYQLLFSLGARLTAFKLGRSEQLDHRSPAFVWSRGRVLVSLCSPEYLQGESLFRVAQFDSP